MRESEERFRLMADTAPVLVWRAGPDKLCDFVNRPWLEFTGRTIEQELGNGWSEGVCAGGPGQLPAGHTCRHSMRASHSKWSIVFAEPTACTDGSSTTAFRDTDRTAVSAGYIGSCLDITDRKESEDALRESQQRYTMASAAGAVGVWDWNFETNELYVDPTLKSLLGFEDAEITTRPDDWGSRVHPEDLPAAAARVKACIDGATDVYEVEHRMLHKDGSSRWFLSRGSAMRGVDGTLHRLVGTKVDITERKRAEEGIRDSEAALQASYARSSTWPGRSSPPRTPSGRASHATFTTT